MTIAGTCWLPPVNHSGPFTPQTDLPNICYQDLPNNPVLAINCYTQKQTPFQIDEQVRKFTQFATASLLRNDLEQLDKLITYAEQRNHQIIEDILTPFHIQQEAPTQEDPPTAMIQAILTNSQLWSCLQYPNIQDKLINLINKAQDTNWKNWWITVGEKQIRLMYQWAFKQPQSEEAAALRAVADRVMNELCLQLATDQQESKEWSAYWDQLLKDISNPTTDLALWSTLPHRLSKLSYNKTYRSWWQQSGKKRM